LVFALPLMQIIWISGSTSKIKRINITARGLIKLGSLFCAVFILAGAGIHFLGFRVAVQLKPDLAREMGGVITLQEKNEIEAGYRERLEQLQDQFTVASKRISELQGLKDHFADLATPVPVRKVNDNGGKGGPYLPLNFHPQDSDSLMDEFDKTLDSANIMTQGESKLEEGWERQYAWLNRLPIGSPIAHSLGLTSNFGMRIDPFTKTLANHPGVDFSAPPGTQILATGNGTVLRVVNDREYGLFVEIKHTDGFVTKYAHTRKVFVEAGQTVTRGQLIAEVGSTGRATGPHLHYEVIKDGTLINPMLALAASHSNN